MFKLSGALRRDYPKDKCFPLIARTPLTPTACQQQTRGEQMQEPADESCRAAATRPSKLQIHGTASKTVRWKH